MTDLMKWTRIIGLMLTCMFLLTVPSGTDVHSQIAYAEATVEPSQQAYDWEEFSQSLGAVVLPGAMVPFHDVLVQVPSKADARQIINSWDIPRGLPQYRFEPMVYWPDSAASAASAAAAGSGKWLTLQTMQVKLPGKSAANPSLTFRFVKVSGRVILVKSNPYAVIVQQPEKGIYLFEYQQNIYQIDLKSKKAELFLAEKTGAYSRSQLINKKDEETVLIWGANAMISPSGRYVAYYSNRQGLLVPRGKVIGQIWLKDRKTGRERAIYNGSYEIMGWDRDGHLYIIDQQQVQQIDSVTGSIKRIRSNVPLSTKLDHSLTRLLIPHTGPAGNHQILQLQLTGNEKRVIPAAHGEADLHTVTGAGTAGKPFVAAVMSSERPADRLLLTGLQSGRQMFAAAPQGMLIRFVAAYGGFQLAVVLRNLESGQELTYLLDLRKWSDQMPKEMKQPKASDSRRLYLAPQKQLYPAITLKPWDRKFQEVMWPADGIKPQAEPFSLPDDEWIGMSPVRSGGMDWLERFPPVSSAENQPRHVMNGSNPHQGVDLPMQEDQVVYPVTAGYVVYVAGQPERFAKGTEARAGHEKALRKQMGQLIINQDLNGDGQADGVYMNYLHVIPDKTLRPGTYVTAQQPVAVVSPYMPGRYGAHLHFNWSDFRNRYTYKTGMFFRHVEPWQYGADLDVLFRPQREGNIFYIEGTVNNYNNKTVAVRQPLKRMEIYYRIRKDGEDGGWQPKPRLMKPVKGSGGFRWMFDFSTIAQKGAEIEFYVAGIRGKDDSFPDPDPSNPRKAPYSWALWPNHYNHPAKTPKQFGANPIRYDSFPVN